MTAPVVDLSFPHRWQAEILTARPLILPPRHFVYPRDAEEVERGALEVLVKPELDGVPPFLATCALGFKDPVVPSGIWSAPSPEEICAVAGGYAYVINSSAPESFTMIPFRPVLQIHCAPVERRLLFVGHHSILGWGEDGLAWQSDKLSDEGVSIARIADGLIAGTGWEMMSDAEKPFSLDIQSGRRL